MALRGFGWEGRNGVVCYCNAGVTKHTHLHGTGETRLHTSVCVCWYFLAFFTLGTCLDAELSEETRLMRECAKFLMYIWPVTYRDIVFFNESSFWDRGAAVEVERAGVNLQV